MEKPSPFLTASIATAGYIIILIILKSLLENKEIDWQSTILSAVVFWIVIFLVHYFLNRRYGS